MKVGGVGLEIVEVLLFDSSIDSDLITAAGDGGELDGGENVA